MCQESPGSFPVLRRELIRAPVAVVHALRECGLSLPQPWRLSKRRGSQCHPSYQLFLRCPYNSLGTFPCETPDDALPVPFGRESPCCRFCSQLHVGLRRPMDIQKWVQGVVADEQRGIPDRPELAEALQPRERDTGAGDSWRKRKHPEDGSSFLELRRSRLAPQITSPCSEAAESSYPSLPHERDVSNEKYKRKPRHKTRVERYEGGKNASPPRGKGKTPKDVSRGGKRGKRTAKEKPDTAQMRKFKAKNVVGDRLTVSFQRQGHKLHGAPLTATDPTWAGYWCLQQRQNNGYPKGS
jgi:hypothetical protein